MSDEVVSKTKRKQEMHELQALGAALVSLPEAQVRELSLEAPLRDAVLEARRIKSHEARRRQMQYIGRLMRNVDAAPIRERLAALEGHSASATAFHRRLEGWRERLLADDAALTEFAQAFPHADLQALRALLRNARKELKEGRPPRAQREIFRLLRDAATPTPAQG
jgi:ribosome-associated protein